MCDIERKKNVHFAEKTKFATFPFDSVKLSTLVIKDVDRDRWVSISKIAKLLKVGTAMAAEVMGVCACSRKSSTWYSPNASVFRISIGALTQFLTNNEVEFLE